MMAADEKSFETVGDGSGTHVRASRARSRALGSPRSARVGSGTQPRLDRT